ncbi:MAG: hypothetical protein MRECE_13c020 [Mycoplasmataceae bacterium CE_OT135]|nr:MAG: hypothetical protein MRECE_13c020 [Mycoplasmataceae bacterium CE_OT135]
MNHEYFPCYHCHEGSIRTYVPDDYTGDPPIRAVCNKPECQEAERKLKAAEKQAKKEQESQKQRKLDGHYGEQILQAIDQAKEENYSFILKNLPNKDGHVDSWTTTIDYAINSLQTADLKESLLSHWNKKKQILQKLKNQYEQMKVRIQAGELVTDREIDTLLNENWQKELRELKEMQIRLNQAKKIFYQALAKIKNDEPVNIKRLSCTEEQKKVLEAAQKIINSHWRLGEDTSWIDKIEYTWEYYGERGYPCSERVKLSSEYRELLKSLQKEVYQTKISKQNQKNLPNQSQKYLIDCQNCQKKYQTNYHPDCCPICQSREIKVLKDNPSQSLPPLEPLPLPEEQANHNSQRNFNFCQSCQKILQPGETYWTNPQIPDKKTCQTCHQIEKTKQKETSQRRIIGIVLGSCVIWGLTIWGLVWIFRKRKKAKNTQN